MVAERRVLIVDDHALMRRGIRELLAESLGAAFGEAANASEAIEQLSSGPWDLVVLDLLLPGRDGLDLLDEIARRWPKTGVLVLTGLREDEYGPRAIRAGAAGFLTKGTAPEELIAAVRAILEGGRHLSPALAGQLAGGSSRAELSHRELQILRRVAKGMTRRQIAEELQLSEKTIATYRDRISIKLGVSTNVELTRYALLHGLIE